jgi:hypothetical protein
MKWFLGLLSALVVAGVGWVSSQLYTVISSYPTTQTTIIVLVGNVEDLTQANNDLLLALEKSKLESIQTFITLSEAMHHNRPEEVSSVEVSYSAAPIPYEAAILDPIPLSLATGPTVMDPTILSVWKPPPSNAAAVPHMPELSEAEVVRLAEIKEAEDSLKGLMARELEQRKHVETLESSRKK